MHIDHRPYHRLTARSRLDKAVNSLLGLMEGISIDSVITSSELEFLAGWIAEHEQDSDRHPFNELVPAARQALVDGVLTEDERADILYVCHALRSTTYYDRTTADLQSLHAVIGGIVADAVISEGELRGLREWLGAHAHLRTCWPYDEVDTLVTRVLADGKIDEHEHAELVAFFGDFISVVGDRTIVNPLVADSTSTTSLVGLCAVDPEIEFADARFCFTGASKHYKRAQLIDIVTRLGGQITTSVTRNVRYLVVGASGNPCWAYACYGRKVEEAVRLRKSGATLLVIHENDFHDAVLDHPGSG